MKTNNLLEIAINSSISAGLGALLLRSKIRGSLNEEIDWEGIGSGLYKAGKKLVGGAAQTVVDKVSGNDTVAGAAKNFGRAAGKAIGNTFQDLPTAGKVAAATAAGVGGYKLGLKAMQGTANKLNSAANKMRNFVTPQPSEDQQY